MEGRAHGHFPSTLPSFHCLVQEGLPVPLLPISALALCFEKDIFSLNTSVFPLSLSLYVEPL